VVNEREVTSAFRRGKKKKRLRRPAKMLSFPRGNALGTSARPYEEKKGIVACYGKNEKLKLAQKVLEGDRISTISGR